MLYGYLVVWPNKQILCVFNFQHSSLTYCIPLAKNQSSFYEFRTLAICLNIKAFNQVKVSEYPFKENENTLKIIQVLLYTDFHNIYVNVLRPNFLNICDLPISHVPNIRKIRVKVGPKTNYFSYFMSSCTDRIVVFNHFFSLILSQPRDQQNRARDFLLFKYFLNNLLLTVFMQNALSKHVKLLQ